jgi:EAL and modified HD-GYP domain-containing signal transduction protein
MELAARVLRPSDEAFADAAFMTGIFSLVHVVVDMPPAEILAQLNLSEEIQAAIGSGRGALGALLGMSQAADRGDLLVIDPGISDAAFARLTPAALARLHVEAATWFAAHRLE